VEAGAEAGQEQYWGVYFRFVSIHQKRESYFLISHTIGSAPEKNKLRGFSFRSEN
jgi:hypothetical protein